MTDVLVFAIWTVFELLFVVTGRSVVKALTFNRWRIADISTKESSTFGAAGALSFKREGRRVVTETGQLFVGLLFYVVLCTGLAVWMRWP